MSDELAATNRARWNALVEANVQYSRPLLDLTPDSARDLLDLRGIMDDVAGKQILCLASGGGQQSVAFALLGAEVTVFDLSDRQLERDRAAAAHYGVTLHTLQGDMRYLGAFDDDSFDLVYQAYSINFVPSVTPTIAEVARISRPGAPYRLTWANPFTQTIHSGHDWTGTGYLLRHAYKDGREVTEMYPTWTVEDETDSPREFAGPREFVHTFSTVLNTLAAHHFVIVRAAEYLKPGDEHEPGSWSHFVNTAPPYLMLWARYRPDAFT